jgi:hypothetical protein
MTTPADCRKSNLDLTVPNADKAQHELEESDAYKNEMARRAGLSGQFGSRRDTAGGSGDSLSPRFTTDVSGRVIVTGPAPEESESSKASRKLVRDHKDIQI